MDNQVTGFEAFATWTPAPMGGCLSQSSGRGSGEGRPSEAKRKAKTAKKPDRQDSDPIKAYRSSPRLSTTERTFSYHLPQVSPAKKDAIRDDLRFRLTEVHLCY